MTVYHKAWHLQRRDVHHVGRYAVARLMRELGLRGVVRGGRMRTTIGPGRRPWGSLRRLTLVIASS